MRALAVALMLVGTAMAEGPSLTLATSKVPTTLHFDVTVNGQPAGATWEGFTAALFQHFDRNGDGALSAAESARITPLPLPQRGALVIDFRQLDDDGDGKVTLSRFRDCCRTGGFAPVVAVKQSPSPESQRLSEALFRHLDADADGKLTRAELEAAPRLLDKLDEDENEAISAAELRSAGDFKASGRADKSSEREFQRLPINLGGTNPTHFDVNGHMLRIAVETQGPDYESGAKFYRTQFRDALGGEAFLSKQRVEDDDGLRAVAALFDPADRDGDGRLTMDEVDRFLRLMTMGAACQVTIILDERGRNLFDALDENGDGRLDLGELNRAAKVIAELPATRKNLPRRSLLTARPGPPGDAFGPLRPVKRVAPPALKPTIDAPRWFTAMDRNGDGRVSSREYLGPPESFGKLDADCDGFVSAAEAGSRTLK